MTGMRTAPRSGTLVTFRERAMTARTVAMAPDDAADEHGGDRLPGSDISLLVKGAASGDQAAWDALVARYTNLLWSIARGYRLERTDAADVVQVAWLRLVEHLPRLRDPERVGAWLATTVRRECLQVVSRRKRDLPVVDDVFDAVPDTSAPVDARLLADEQATTLWSAFEQISGRCQHLLRVLMADPPPSYVEVSEVMEMPVGSIGPTRARCLDRLRVILDENEHGDAERGDAETGGAR
jgi:RNA polymerase sigma factor (sigma-70 family)